MIFSNKLFSYDPLIHKTIKLEAGEIFQVSELSLIRSGEMPQHVQVCDEITYAVSGSAEIYSDSSCCEISAGQIHFIKKGINHKIVANNDKNFRYICIGFLTNEACRDISAFSEAIKDKSWFVAKDTAKIRTILEMLVDEFYHSDESTEAMLNAYIKQILISVARAYTGRISSGGKTSSSTSNFAVYNALKYIDRNYLYITNVKQVSEALSYSEFYISHLFKEKMGMSIKEYLMQKKMMAAAEILETNNLTIGELAEYLNFGTTHTFSQAFKRYHGVSPMEYKKSKSKF